MSELDLYKYARLRRGPGSLPYDAEETQFVLGRRLLMPRDISLDETDLHPRISTGLPVGEVSYVDGWHNQGWEGTCSVWSIVNAMRAIGVEPDPGYIKQLLNHAIVLDGSDQRGIAFDTAHDMSQGRDMAARLALPSEQILTHLPRIPHLDDPTGENIVRRNARIIETCVTSTSALIISKPSNRGRDGTRRAHAVCITGYRVSPEGHMDVQVIDSAIGPRVYGIEALSRQLYVNPTRSLVVSKA